MKKALLIGALVALTAGLVYAGLDVYDSVTVKALKTPAILVGVQTNAAVDVSGAKGTCNLLVFFGSGTNGGASVVSATVKHATTSAGTYITLTNAAGTACVFTNSGTAAVGAFSSTKVEADRLRRYIKVYTSVAGEEAIDCAAYLLYSK
jgi:hypothetical protein